MRLKRIILLLLTIACTFCMPVKVQAASCEVYVSGRPAGFILDTKGAEIIGLSDVLTSSGAIGPAESAGLTGGDIIISLDGVEVSTSAEIERALEKIKSGTVSVRYVRGSEEKTTELSPAKDLRGRYKLGVFIRDNLSGIGTMTFVDKQGRYGALGHPVVSDNGRLIALRGGAVYACNILGVNRAEKGKAGELRGIFVKEDRLGTVETNNKCGIFGKYEGKYEDMEQMPLGEAIIGAATIRTTIFGLYPKDYEISIVKVDQNSKEQKHLVLKIDSEELLNSSGGILQGMSGSPIIQNGRLVGAVTHVFLNDSTRGYGILIESMINE